MDTTTLAIFGLPGGAEWIVIGVLALLIFGRRLPEVARSLGKSIVEFKRGIKDVKDDVEVTARLDAPTQPKIEPPNVHRATAPQQQQPANADPLATNTERPATNTERP
ncbi:MAG: twin-arginine translocase TatA/TatE family subunit, partial [Phycisphaerae bacterium]